MSLTTVAAEPIILGSGELYLGLVPNVESADDATIDAGLTNVGAISSGASLEYNPTIYEVKSGNRGTIMQWITEEVVLFKTGIITWNLDNLSILAPVSQTNTASEKRIGIGGVQNLPVNYLRFIHTKADGNKLIVNIFKASSNTGFTLNFDRDREMSIDAEFKALATTKSDGNLVEIIEEIGSGLVPTVTGLNFTTKAASTLPALLVSTGVNYKNTSIVFLEKSGVKTYLRTLFDSSTQLTSELPSTIVAGTYTVKVKNGYVESTTSVTLTIT